MQQRVADSEGEILSDDEDDVALGEEPNEGAADKAGGALVAVTFVVVILGAALLPLLLFL